MSRDWCQLGGVINPLLVSVDETGTSRVRMKASEGLHLARGPQFGDHWPKPTFTLIAQPFSTFSTEEPLK